MGRLSMAGTACCEPYERSRLLHVSARTAGAEAARARNCLGASRELTADNEAGANGVPVALLRMRPESAGGQASLPARDLGQLHGGRSGSDRPHVRSWCSPPCGHCEENASNLGCGETDYAVYYEGLSAPSCSSYGPPVRSVVQKGAEVVVTTDQRPFSPACERAPTAPDVRTRGRRRGQPVPFLLARSDGAP